MTGKPDVCARSLRILGTPCSEVAQHRFRVTVVFHSGALTIACAVLLEILNVGFVLLRADLLAVLRRVGAIARVDLPPMRVDILVLPRDQNLTLLGVALAVRRTPTFQERTILGVVSPEPLAIATHTFACQRSLLFRWRALVSSPAPRLASAVTRPKLSKVLWIGAKVRPVSLRLGPAAFDGSHEKIGVRLDPRAVAARRLTVVGPLLVARVHSLSDTQSPKSCQWDLRRSANRAAASSMSGSAFRIASASGIPEGVLTSIASTPCVSSAS